MKQSFSIYTILQQTLKIMNNKYLYILVLLLIPFISASAQEDETAVMNALLDKLEKARAKKDVNTEIETVKLIKEEFKENSIALMFIPQTEQQKQDFAIEERRFAFRQDPGFQQYELMVSLLEHQALAKAGDKKADNPLFNSTIDQTTGYFKNLYEAYRHKLRGNYSNQASYKDDCKLKTLHYLILADQEETDNSTDTPLMHRLENLTGFHCNDEFLNSMVKETGDSVRALTEEQISAVLQRYRLKNEWHSDFWPIACALTAINNPRGFYLVGINRYARNHYDEAEKFFRDGARFGNKKSELFLAQTLYNRRDDPGVMEEMNNLILNNLNNPDFDEIGSLPYGHILETGYKCEADTTAALDYYMKAWERTKLKPIQDEAYARQKSLFNIYEAADAQDVVNEAYSGVDESAFESELELAKYYYELNDSVNMLATLHRAIDKGDESAMTYLGERYYDGKLLKADISKTVKYTQMALDRNPRNAVALNNMAMLLAQGEGVDPDLDKAKEMIALSIECGNTTTGEGMKQHIHNLDMANSLNAMGDNNLKKKNYGHSLYYYGRSAKKGNAYGKYHVALHYLGGLGVKTDMEKAKELLRQTLPYKTSKELLEELEKQ